MPLKPFCGTIGVAPAAPGLHSIVPPREVGGNMDIRDLSAGTVLYLPVAVPGALFSVGDTHATQGDGEVCGSAIESPMDLAVTFDLVKGANLAFPRYETPGPVSRHFDEKGYHVTTGIGPDLFEGTRAAVKRDDRPHRIPARSFGRGRLHALQRVCRPPDQRGRGPAELGGVLLLPEGRLRLTGTVPKAEIPPVISPMR